MTEEQDVTPPRQRKWRWLKIGALVFAVLLALLIAFHRPLIFQATRYFAVRLAKKQNLDLDYQIRGTIFTGLIIDNLRVTPAGPGPIDKITIERLGLAYSLPGLLSKGLPGFLQRLELRNAYIEITPDEPTEKPKGPRQAVKFPAVFPAEVRIENLVFISHQEAGDLELRNFDFILQPQEPGRLAFQKLTIPGFRTWTDVEASTTYRERNLRIENLRLDESIAIALLNLDASQLEDSILGFKLQASLFGGSASLEGAIADLNASNRIKLEARILSLSLQRMGEYLKLEAGLSGDIRQAHIVFTGPLEKPAEWNSRIELNMDNAVFGETQLQRIVLEAETVDGTAKVNLQTSLDPENHLRLKAEAALADQLENLAKSDITGTAELDIGALANLPVPHSDIQTGSLKANVPFTLRDGVVKATPEIALRDFSGYQTSVQRADVSLQVQKSLGNGKTSPPASPYEGLSYEGRLSASDAQSAGFALDEATLQYSGKEQQLNVTQLDLERGDNRISATAAYTLPGKNKKPADMPLEFQAQIDAPALAQFATDPDLGLRGVLQARADVTHSAEGWNGEITVESDGLAYKDVQVSALDIEGTIQDNQADFSALNVRFDEENFIAGKAKVGLEKPFPYDADLEVKLANLSRFAPLIPAAEDTGQRPELGGAVTLDWRGQGTLADLQNDGTAQLSVKNARFGENREINATVNGQFTRDRIQVPGLTFSSSAGQIRGDLLIENKTLNLSNVQIEIPGKADITGDIILPFDPQNLGEPAKMFPADGKLKINLTAKNIRLEPLLKKEDAEKVPVTGQADLNVTADGTLAAPDLRATVNATNLRFAAVSDLQPARLQAEITLPSDQLNLNARFELPGLAPLTVQARYPLSIPEILARKAVDMTAPVEAQVTLPSSSLNFLARASDEVRRADGEIAIDARLSGTIQQPMVSGSARLAIRSLRLSNQNIPPVTDFTGNIVFSQDEIRFEKFSGALAGGPFTLTGTIGLQPLTNPTFDLQFTAQNALLTRNETVTVRANADVSVRGDLQSSAVTGKIGITNSRFFREIDILPLQLPGRPAPKPPPAPEGEVVSLPPALADWIFDVKIVTDDPFLIRGNLASGNVVVDLQFTGKGESPALDGYAYLQNFVASLPFSQLDIVSGYVYFTPDRPFVPILDLYGSSEIRNYKINVYIYGEASNPETLFSSEPPLPQEDIISLLATGTTTEELTGSSDVAAGRAAALLLQKLSRTLFKNKKPPPPGSFLDRFDLNVGAVDPRTGNQEAQAKYRLTERFYIIGDLDIQGELSGQVKYLIRFR